MKRLLLCIVALASCQKTDPLYCGKHPGACNDGGGFLTDGDDLFNIGGMVSGVGLSSGLVLQNNGGDDAPISTDGMFRFPTKVMMGGGYDVSVSIQPANPTKVCTVTNGSGSVGTTDVTDVQVTCVAASYHIGGTVTGLGGMTVTLSNNNSETVMVSADGMFQFPTPLPSGQTFAITRVGGDPNCSVFGGMGTVGSADVTSVVVNCSTTGPFAVGGMLIGLDPGSVTLKNNSNGDLLKLTGNGTYSFPADTASGGPYNIVVQAQPSYPPAEQNCVVANGSGTAGGNVVNVNVTCTTTSHMLSGSVSGNTGNVVVQNEGANDQTATVSAPNFSFGEIPSGSPYQVTVLTAPLKQSCNVAMGTGTITSADVTNVAVTCKTVNTILCGSSSSTYCITGSEHCCDPAATAMCEPNATACGAGLVDLTCDSKSDCSSSKYCCISTNGNSGNLNGASCTTTSTSNCSSQKYLCDPSEPSPCPSGTTCQQDGSFDNYYWCK